MNRLKVRCLVPWKSSRGKISRKISQVKIYGQFPAVRMRRMRRDDFSRRLMREHRLTADALIYPVFIIDGKARTEKVASMPGIERVTLDNICEAAAISDL